MHEKTTRRNSTRQSSPSPIGGTRLSRVLEIGAGVVLPGDKPKASKNTRFLEVVYSSGVSCRKYCIKERK